MSQPLKILLLEDNPTDAEIIERLLKKQHGQHEFSLAMNKKSFIDKLDQFSPDVILSDNSLPQFDALEALKVTRERSSNIPFILVTGTVSEEFAANVIKNGADDYILKDRMARLPAAIDAALKQRSSIKELTDYKYALDQAAIVAITDQKGIILYANENFCKISKYKVEELIGSDHRMINSGYHPSWYIKDLWMTIANGGIWRGEFRNKAKDGSFYWVDTTIIPFLNEKNKPYQYLSIRSDITERKKAEEELREQQLRITASTLEAQEKERDAIGQELHDNVNQILVGTKLLLSMIKNRPDRTQELVQTSIDYLQKAIEENRHISHTLVTPDLRQDTLVSLINSLTEMMLKTAGLDVYISQTNFKEELLTHDQKLMIYRISQEQCTNIVKYAAAHLVNINLTTTDSLFTMQIADDGIGTDPEKLTNGIGLKNIKGRLSVFKGTANITTEPGKGFVLEVKMPLE